MMKYPSSITSLLSCLVLFLLSGPATAANDTRDENLARLKERCEKNYAKLGGIISNQYDSSMARLAAGIASNQRLGLQAKTVATISLGKVLKSYAVKRAAEYHFQRAMVSYLGGTRSMTWKAYSKDSKALVEGFKKDLYSYIEKTDRKKLVGGLRSAKSADRATIEAVEKQAAALIEKGRLGLLKNQTLSKLAPEAFEPMAEKSFSKLLKLETTTGKVLRGAEFVSTTYLVSGCILGGAIVAEGLFSGSRENPERQWADAVEAHPELLLNPYALSESAFIQDGDSPELIACNTFDQYPEKMAAAMKKLPGLMEKKFQSDVKSLVRRAQLKPWLENSNGTSLPKPVQPDWLAPVAAEDASIHSGRQAKTLPASSSQNRAVPPETDRSTPTDLSESAQ